MQPNITLSKTTLLKYTVLSIAFAAVVLLTVILPAEYHIDPTGLGHKLGLTVFNDENAVTGSPNVATKSNNIAQTITVTVPAGLGVEYKFDMTQYQKIEYQWTTDGTALFFDLHGDPKGDTTGYFESYAKATLNGMKGSFTVPFSGAHGWYWKNKSDSPVTVQLTVKGDYLSHGLK
jgi:hypothetical protein